MSNPPRFEGKPNFLRKILRATRSWGDETRVMAAAGIRRRFRAEVLQVARASDEAAREADAELLASTFIHSSLSLGRLPMLNDLEGTMIESLGQRRPRGGGRDFEAALGQALLTTVPSPKDVAWDELADVRTGLDLPLTPVPPRCCSAGADTGRKCRRVGAGEAGLAGRSCPVPSRT